SYFGANGLGYTLGRVPIGSSDFSVEHYSCVDSADESADTFKTYIDDEYLIPMIHAAQNTAGQPIGLLLSPWSPPGFMKSNGERNNGGKLRPEYKMSWAACMAKYAAYYKKSGCDVRLMSIQNEPEAIQTWDSCIWTAEEEGEFATNYLAPALSNIGCADVGILAWDHNKEGLIRRTADTLTIPGAAKTIKGFALHWYTGDHFEALRTARRIWPDKELWFTEGCVEYGRFGGISAIDKAEMYAHDIIGNLNVGICGSIDWNLILDANGGPNHAGNFCEAPIMLDEDGTDFILQSEYYYIGHFSRYIRPGAVCLATSSWNSRIEVTAFENTDGSRVLVALNRTDTPFALSVTETGDTAVNFELPKHAIATILLF
ncbi:MAG: glucosylceramidase, partial [Ruminococcaceae bacterium]|nr:glucosylceramidase [Oscillospiraceae bacterium]